MAQGRINGYSVGVMTLLAAITIPAAASADRGGRTRHDWSRDNDYSKAAHVEVFAPEKGYVSGVGSRGVLVDLAIEFKGNLASTGVTPELTGPGPLMNAGPFPGTFGLGANSDHFPGLVVLLSSTAVGAGPGQNVANLFNITTVTDQTVSGTEIWSTWIVGAPNAFGRAGSLTPSRLFVAVVRGTAPDVVMDLDGNGKFVEKDLRNMGLSVISNTPEVDFVVNGLEFGF